MAKLYVSNKDESVRLFQSNALEFFTHVHWSVPIIIYIPTVSYFLYLSVTGGLLTGAAIVGNVLGGLFIWTLSEYLLHRFIFHYQPKSKIGNHLHFMMHGVHHAYPNDATRLVMPPSVSIPLAALFYFLFALIFPTANVAPLFAGFLFGYVCYDEIHYATHHAPLKGSVGLWLKHHHVRHHYLDPDRGYGVSSPLWDYVFGTMYKSSETVSAKTEDA